MNTPEWFIKRCEREHNLRRTKTWTLDQNKRAGVTLDADERLVSDEDVAKFKRCCETAGRAPTIDDFPSSKEARAWKSKPRGTWPTVNDMKEMLSSSFIEIVVKDPEHKIGLKMIRSVFGIHQPTLPFDPMKDLYIS